MTATVELPHETSFPKDRIRVLLLEGIHESARDVFRQEGFQLETVTGALDEDTLVERLRDIHILGIRSRTHITDRAISRAGRLLTLGAFCIGTNQV
ncbi:MAG: phosphoglycerate dehydrogenase, partial [Chloroflexi bacterium]|nr:phosphoglycerate dehydrogenase [Chloroflexota bacterium]